MTLSKVFEPITIRNTEIANRIVVAAHGTGFSSPRDLIGGEDFVAYHASLAKGGAGLDILEATAVHPSSQAMTRSDDRSVARYEEIMAAVRPHGTRVFQQVFHPGSLLRPTDGSVPWAVSTVPSLTGLVGSPITREGIEEVWAAFGTAARRCEEGGLDGVELHASHGTLPLAFLSPLYNTRTDEFGGSLENRMRFVRGIMKAMRDATGDGFCVGVRFGASEMPGSIHEQELAEVVRSLQEEGLIDFLSSSLGDFFRGASITGGMEYRVGYQLPSTEQFMSAATVPTIAVGRFMTLEQAEQALVDGAADMVAMVRAHIADPDIVRKTREGRADEIRPCIACNQACNGGALYTGKMACTVNPVVGFERTLAEDLIEPAEHPRRVLVVGGGPAGLEAARVASLCGHRVKLVEASSSLGGALNAARRAPRWGMLGDIVDWLQASVERGGVEVVLDTNYSTDDIRDENADAVIVATGSTPRMDGFQIARPFDPARGVDQPHVLSSNRLMTEGVPAGAKTGLVLDTVGHFEAIGVAEYLADKGLGVAFVTGLPSLGNPAVHATFREVSALEYLFDHDMNLLVRHHLAEIRPGSCVVHGLWNEDHPKEVPADVVVLVTQNAPNRELYDELVAAGVPDVFVVGDAAAPRELTVAMAEGHRAARAVPTSVPLATA
jgi:2,4-dienoyl-CoA reductase-like NADH-dependent reductase (Old Yellow Enzyme family)